MGILFTKELRYLGDLCFGNVFSVVKLGKLN